jgi:heme/copper-type cytochrome/quinol oxidase subunit 3
VRKQTMTQKHPFHLVDPSPWPLRRSTAAFVLRTGAVRYRHNYAGGGFVRTLGLCRVLATRAVWFRDVIREGTYEGQHTAVVQLGLRFGRMLFMLSEVRFFLAFFWAFFWAALAPTPEMGSVWPPKGMEVLDAWGMPFLNTAILLTSGASVTWAHHARVAGRRDEALRALFVTVGLAVIFTALQGYEYVHASFTMADSVYGSTFYRATGFHGFHVRMGTAFLTVCLVRLRNYHFTREHHFGFEAAAWYWHFVDVVWLFLFVSIYYWGS